MKKEVLIVDDQPGIRLLLHDVLANDGYMITTATTGKEAVDLLQSNTFDMIVLDYILPVMNGIEVLQVMEYKALHIPAIMITGMKATVLSKIAAIGMEVEVLAKPFNVEDMCTLVRNLLAKNK